MGEFGKFYCDTTRTLLTEYNIKLKEYNIKYTKKQNKKKRTNRQKKWQDIAECVSLRTSTQPNILTTTKTS